MTSPAETQELITEECDKIKNLLLEKNRKYGNSALEPKRIFSKASPMEQILIRIDDKLSRIATSGFESADEDTLQDLIGYLVLLRVARRIGGDAAISPPALVRADMDAQPALEPQRCPKCAKKFMHPRLVDAYPSCHECFTLAASPGSKCFCGFTTPTAPLPIEF